MKLNRQHRKLDRTSRIPIEDDIIDDTGDDIVDPIDDKDDGIDSDDNYDEDFGDDDLTDEYYGETQPPMEKRADLLKDLTNFNPYMRESFNNWLGLTWDEDNEKYVNNPLVTPIMSIQGALWCAGIMKTYTRGNNVITDVSYEEYKNIMMDHITVVFLNLGTRDDLGIKEDGDLLRVANELIHSASLALQMAGDGKSRDWLGTSVTRHENVNPNQQIGQGFGNYQMPMQQYGQKPSGALGKLKRLIMGR